MNYLCIISKRLNQWGAFAVAKGTLPTGKESLAGTNVQEQGGLNIKDLIRDDPYSKKP